MAGYPFPIYRIYQRAVIIRKNPAEKVWAVLREMQQVSPAARVSDLAG
jgi:hypothetical protein